MLLTSFLPQLIIRMQNIFVEELMNRFRLMRLSKQKTQVQLMRETGIFYSTISRIERGWLKPSKEQKEKLAKALNVSQNWLFPE